MKIGIFTVQREASSFLRADAVKQTVGMFTVYKFTLGKHDAVLCCPPSVGEISASAACQLLITDYHVDCIFNFGVVGALTPKMSTQSFVYVKDVVHYDMDTSVVEGYPVGKYSCFDDVAVTCCQTLLAKAMKINSLPAVRCASADKFVDGAEPKTALHKQFGADICDMESAGILFTCRFNNVPCLLVKCVSDSLTGGYGEYCDNVHSACQGFFAFAEQLANNM